MFPVISNPTVAEGIAVGVRVDEGGETGVGCGEAIGVGEKVGVGPGVCSWLCCRVRCIGKVSSTDGI